MNSTALDLGTAGRDNYYGNGLVQAYNAWVYLGGGGQPTVTPTTPTPTEPTTPTVTVTPSPTPTTPAPGTLVVTVTTNKASYVNRETVTITTLVKDALGNLVSGASVSSVMTTANGTKLTKTGTTGTSGTYVYTYHGQHPQAWHRHLFGDLFSNKVGYTTGSGTVTFLVQ